MDRRAHDHRQSNDRRLVDLPRLLDLDAAFDAAAQALAVGEAIATERGRMAAEFELTQLLPQAEFEPSSARGPDGDSLQALG